MLNIYAEVEKKKCNHMNLHNLNKVNVNLSLSAECKHVQDVKEETEDYAISKQPEAHGGGSPGETEAGKRASADMGSDTDQSTSSKRARLSTEVSKLTSNNFNYQFTHLNFTWSPTVCLYDSNIISSV